MLVMTPPNCPYHSKLPAAGSRVCREGVDSAYSACRVANSGPRHELQSWLPNPPPLGSASMKGYHLRPSQMSADVGYGMAIGLSLGAAGSHTSAC